jgi:hypothetical protein
MTSTISNVYKLLLCDLHQIAKSYFSNDHEKQVAEPYLLYELKKSPFDRWKGLTPTMLAGMLLSVGVHSGELGQWRGKQNVRGYSVKDIISAAEKYGLASAA